MWAPPDFVRHMVFLAIGSLTFGCGRTGFWPLRPDADGLPPADGADERSQNDQDLFPDGGDTNGDPGALPPTITITRPFGSPDGTILATGVFATYNGVT